MMLRSAARRGTTPAVELAWQPDPECTCEACRIRRLVEVEIEEINEFVFPFARRAYEKTWYLRHRYDTTTEQRKIANHTLVAWRKLREDLIADALARAPRTEGCTTRKLVVVKDGR